MKLKNKFYLLFLLSTVLVLGTVLTVGLYREKKVFYKRLEERGLSISRSLSLISVNSFITNNFHDLSYYLEEINKDKSVAYVIITDPYGKVLFHPDYSQKNRVLYDPVSIRAVRAKEQIHQIYRQGNHKIFEVSSPIQFASVKWGTIRVGFDLNAFNSELQKNIQFSLLLILGIIAIASLTFLFIGDRIVHPIEQLTAATQKISQGNFSVKVPHTTKDEVGALSGVFNQMVESLGEKTTKLEEANKRATFYNNKLQKKINALFTINRASKVLQSNMNIDAKIRLILRMSMHVSGAQDGAFFNFPGNRKVPSLRVQRGSKVDTELFFKLARKAADSGQVVALTNGKEVVKGTVNFKEKKINTVAYPLGRKNSLLGVVVLSFADKSFVFDDLQVVSTFLEEAYIIMENFFLTKIILESKQVDSFNKLASIIIHDLRGAITSLSLSLSNAKKHYHEPQFRKDFLSTISASINKIHSLTEKIAGYPTSLELKPCLINDILKEVIDELKLRKLKNITLKEDFKDIPSLMLDASSVKKVFRNIIVNALEAMPRGGTIKMSSSLDNSNYCVLVKVEDTGMGMSQDFIENHLFRPFVTTKKKGLGLALYSAKEIISLHGGDMEVKSRVGQGTSFIIRLPLFSKNSGVAMIRKRLGQYLLDMRAITEEQLEEAMQVQTSDERKIGKILIDMGYIRRREMQRALEKQKEAERKVMERLLRDYYETSHFDS